MKGFIPNFCNAVRDSDSLKAGATRVFATRWVSGNFILNDRKVMTMILYVYKKTEI